MRIGFFPNMGKSNIMAVLKMAAHICKDEGIEVFLPDDLESDAPARVLKIPETHILSRILNVLLMVIIILKSVDIYMLI